MLEKILIAISEYLIECGYDVSVEQLKTDEFRAKSLEDFELDDIDLGTILLDVEDALDTYLEDAEIDETNIGTMIDSILKQV